jgi:hypothetical protein
VVHWREAGFRRLEDLHACNKGLVKALVEAMLTARGVHTSSSSSSSSDGGGGRGGARAPGRPEDREAAVQLLCRDVATLLAGQRGETDLSGSGSGSGSGTGQSGGPQPSPAATMTQKELMGLMVGPEDQAICLGTLLGETYQHQHQHGHGHMSSSSDKSDSNSNSSSNSNSQQEGQRGAGATAAAFYAAS